VRWEYRLEGRIATVDEEVCSVSNIKWQIILETDEVD
jgi:hypothetical protein